MNMQIEKLRFKLDIINEKIISLLAKRRQITKEIAQLKKEIKLPVLDKDREKIQNEKIRQIACKFEIDPDVIEKIFEFYIAYCKQEMMKEME